MGGGLVVDTVEADHGGCDVLLPHPPRHKVGDGSIDPVHTEASQQQQLLEVTEAFGVAAGEGDGLGGIFVKPLHGEEETDTQGEGKGRGGVNYLHTYLYVHVCTCTCMYVCTCTYMYVCTCTFMYVCTCI